MIHVIVGVSLDGNLFYYVVLYKTVNVQVVNAKKINIKEIKIIIEQNQEKNLYHLQAKEE